MPYHPSETEYDSPTRPSRHEHSYYRQQPNSQQSYSDTGTVNYSPRKPSVTKGLPGSATLPLPAKRINPPPRRSGNLISLISKFEALDATSIPYDIPSLQPAHLKVTSNTWGGRKASIKLQSKGTSSKLSTIFSPRSKDRHSNYSSLDEVATGSRDKISSSKIVVDPVKTSGSGKLRQVTTPRRSISLRLKHVDGSGSVHGPDKVEPSTKPQKETSKRSSAVKDGIKFWNEGFNKFSAEYHPPVALPLPPIALPQVPRGLTINKESLKPMQRPVAPPSIKRSVHRKKPPCTNPSCINKSDGSTKHSRSSKSLKRAQDPGPAKVRKLHIQDHLTESSQEQPNGTATKSFSSQISPKTTVARKVEISPTIAKAAVSVPTHTTKELYTPAEVWSRSRVPAAMKQKPVERDIQELSNKIAAIYKARNPKEPSENARAASPHLPNQTQSKVHQKKEIFEPTIPAQDPTRRVSKVASMKNFFDGHRTEDSTHQNSLAPGLSRALYGKIKRQFPISRKGSPPRFEVDIPAPLSVPSAPRPPHRSKIPKISPISTNSGHESPVTPVKKGPAAKGLQAMPPITNSMKSRAVSGGIRDKIKLFEAHAPREEKKPSDSVRLRKKQLEVTNTKSQPKAQKKASINAIEVQDVVDELREMEGGARNARKSRSRLPTASTTSQVSGRLDGASPSTRDMIVKEVKCGLKQPKPVRLEEVRRMVWLCRSKNVPDVYKDKSRVLKSKRL